jgi:Protein of unknown function (DUF2785)
MSHAAILACLLVSAWTSAQSTPGSGTAVHDKAYWQAIAKNKSGVPPGTTAAALAPELIANLGSPDPELRDELSLSILTAWIYQNKLLGPEDLRPIVETLRANLRNGIGESGTDTVLRRSFSALTLSIVAARDNETPFLSPAEFRELLDAALAYFHDERDLRGFDAQKGWMHSAAHTADLLKFLARNRNLAQGDQGRILAALTAKNRDAAAPFAQGEDERMARVAISIARRDDLDRTAFRAWLDELRAVAKFPDPPAIPSLRAQQNVRHLMAALWTELSVDERPSPGADFARQALRETIKGLF